MWKILSLLTLNIVSCSFILSTTLSVQAQDGQKTWTTERAISRNAKLRYHWLGVDGGFETVTLIEAISKNQVIKSVVISGQPVFNPTGTRVAFTECWDGGCDRKIRILDLLTLSELQPIQIERESFLAVTWENEKMLKVELERSNSDGKAEARVYVRK